MAKQDKPTVQPVPTMNTNSALNVIEQLMNTHRALADGAAVMEKLRNIENETDTAINLNSEAKLELQKSREALSEIQSQIGAANLELSEVKAKAQQLKEQSQSERTEALAKLGRELAAAQTAAEVALKETTEKTKLQADEYVQTNSALVALQRELDKVRQSAAALAGGL